MTQQKQNEESKAPKMALFQFHVCGSCGGELYNILTLRCNRCMGEVVPANGTPKE